MTNYENFRKQMRNIGVYMALVPVAFGTFARPVHAQERVGERKLIAESANPNIPLDYNGDGHVDSLLAYATLQKDGGRSVEIVSGVSQLEGKLIDKFVLPDGTCLILANADKNGDGEWDVYAKTHPCGDRKARKMFRLYINDGKGNFTPGNP